MNNFLIWVKNRILNAMFLTTNQTQLVIIQSSTMDMSQEEQKDRYKPFRCEPENGRPEHSGLQRTQQDEDNVCRIYTRISFSPFFS